MIELSEILEGLVQRTSEGRLKWKRAVENWRFVTSLDAISIVIEEIEEDRETYHRLDILNESGEIVESLGVQDTTPQQYKQLARLYVLARRSALDIDSTLEKIARALEL